MPKFLCIVIDRHSKKQLAEYTIEADGWYYARHMAANKFRNEIAPPKELDWCIDSLELDEILMDMSINEDYEYEKDGGFDHMST